MKNKKQKIAPFAQAKAKPTIKAPVLTNSKEDRLRTLGLAKGKIVIRDNFDDPILGFEQYQ